MDFRLINVNKTFSILFTNRPVNKDFGVVFGCDAIAYELTSGSLLGIIVDDNLKFAIMYILFCENLFKNYPSLF